MFFSSLFFNAVFCHSSALSWNQVNSVTANGATLAAGGATYVTESVPGAVGVPGGHGAARQSFRRAPAVVGRARVVRQRQALKQHKQCKQLANIQTALGEITFNNTAPSTATIIFRSVRRFQRH